LSKKKRMDSSDSTRETEDETLSLESEEYQETAHPVSSQTVAPEPPSEGPSSATPIASETVPETQTPAPFSPPQEQELDNIGEETQTTLDVAVCELEEKGTPSSQEAKKVSDEVSVCVPGKAFPEEPIDYEDIDDPDLQRACEKLLKMLNHDPWNEFKKYHDEDVRAFVRKHPDTCRVKYDFGHFANKIFPFTMLCTLGASRDSVKGVLDAYESAKDEDDMVIGTPLHYACTYKAKLAVIELLIQTDPTMLHRRNQFDRTPLHQASLFKASAKTVSYLVKQFPQAAETPDKDGYTPLHLACENGASIEVVRTLVSANPEACAEQANNGSTPLHLACSQNASRSVVRILTHAQPEAAELKDRHGNIPLHLAAESIAPVAIVEMLIKAFPDGVYAKSDRGQTPLRIARRKKAPCAVLRLLEE
jgi:ankyrin repeat protein